MDRRHKHYHALLRALRAAPLARRLFWERFREDKAAMFAASVIILLILIASLITRSRPGCGGCFWPMYFLGGGSGSTFGGGGGGNQFVPSGTAAESADFPAAADDDIPF